MARPCPVCTPPSTLRVFIRVRPFQVLDLSCTRVLQDSTDPFYTPKGRARLGQYIELVRTNRGHIMTPPVPSPFGGVVIGMYLRVFLRDVRTRTA